LRLGLVARVLPAVVLAHRLGIELVQVRPAALVHAGLVALGGGFAGVGLRQRDAVAVHRHALVRRALAGRFLVERVRLGAAMVDGAVPRDLRGVAVVLGLDDGDQQAGVVGAAVGWVVGAGRAIGAGAGAAVRVGLLRVAGVVGEDVVVDVQAFRIEVVAALRLVRVGQAVVGDGEADRLVVLDVVGVELELIGGEDQ